MEELNIQKIPGGPKRRRPLHFIWICDCSGSMAGDKIQALNFAIREAIPHMQASARDNPEGQVFVRAIKFSDGAQWHISQETPVEDFKWIDLTADGVTDMGRALSTVADQLKRIPTTERGYPPVLVLISDGQPTDDFNGGLKELMEQPWGKRAVRIAIAIGQDANHDVLQKFIGHPELKPLQANSAETLVKYIKWASTTGLKTASSPRPQPVDPSPQPVPVPMPVPPAPGADDDDDDDIVF